MADCLYENPWPSGGLQGILTEHKEWPYIMAMDLQDTTFNAT